MGPPRLILHSLFPRMRWVVPQCMGLGDEVKGGWNNSRPEGVLRDVVQGCHEVRSGGCLQLASSSFSCSFSAWRKMPLSSNCRPSLPPLPVFGIENSATELQLTLLVWAPYNSTLKFLVCLCSYESMFKSKVSFIPGTIIASVEI